MGLENLENYESIIEEKDSKLEELENEELEISNKIELLDSKITNLENDSEIASLITQEKNELDEKKESNISERKSMIKEVLEISESLKEIKEVNDNSKSILEELTNMDFSLEEGFDIIRERESKISKVDENLKQFKEKHGEV